MGRMFSVARQNYAVTTSNDFFTILAPTNAVVVVHSAFLGQSSDAGDASAEMIRVNIQRHLADQSGGGTSTPRPHLAGDSAFAGTVEHSNATSSTNAVLIAETFNVQAGWYYTPTPEERIVISPNSVGATYPRIAFQMSAPADSLTMNSRVTFEVLGN